MNEFRIIIAFFKDLSHLVKRAYIVTYKVSVQYTFPVDINTMQIASCLYTYQIKHILTLGEDSIYIAGKVSNANWN